MKQIAAIWRCYFAGAGMLLRHSKNGRQQAAPSYEGLVFTTITKRCP
jgi:hypothetical protein